MGAWQYFRKLSFATAKSDEGCLAVEMEAAGVQAVCDYYGLELYDFVVTGDVVDQDDYTPES